LTLVFA
jgi:hypothetical protein